MIWGMEWYSGGSQGEPPQERDLEQEVQEAGPQALPLRSRTVHASLHGHLVPFSLKDSERRPAKTTSSPLSTELQGHLGMGAVGGAEGGLWG